MKNSDIKKKKNKRTRYIPWKSFLQISNGPLSYSNIAVARFDARLRPIKANYFETFRKKLFHNAQSIERNRLLFQRDGHPHA